MFFCYYPRQTLTTLDLERNSISSEGVQYLANALENNTVILIFVPVISYESVLFVTDSNNIES